MFVLSNPTLNGRPLPLPTVYDQALVSIDVPDIGFPPPTHDQFGIAIHRPWVSPTLLKIAKPFDGAEFATFQSALIRTFAKIHGIPWEFLAPLDQVS